MFYFCRESISHVTYFISFMKQEANVSLFWKVVPYKNAFECEAILFIIVKSLTFGLTF